ncbi:hypothetical protein BC937DRAFT_94515 [Endogone sp. FLAS-F59071]|nr:hypothetical protein BC937DRAFT_94515 [Endogone sp. FLAS-F59071]|eukprot:RUS13984.1 hypothetical protein BC937DRAFT_94515 [Endogone sp. FLAS-F59071]
MSLSTLAVLERLATESTLVDLTLLGTREGDAKVLELDNRVGGLATHVVNCILITQPIAPFDCVTESVPALKSSSFKRAPIPHLSSDSVRPGREQLGDTGSVESGLGKTKGGAQTGAAGTDDDGVVGVIDDGVFVGDRALGSRKKKKKKKCAILCEEARNQ